MYNPDFYISYYGSKRKTKRLKPIDGLLLFTMAVSIIIVIGFFMA